MNHFMSRAIGVAALFAIALVFAAAAVFSQSGQSSPDQTAAPSSEKSDTATDNATLNLHQWGAVTLFHGLPSDRVHAIAQTPDGMLWFATDGGLAKYDGRRTQAITSGQLPQGRVLALKVDDAGLLWIGTENGAARYANGSYKSITETEGRIVTAIITPQKNRALMATENGVIFDCQSKDDNGLVVRLTPEQPLQSADKDHP